MSPLSLKPESVAVEYVKERDTFAVRSNRQPVGAAASLVSASVLTSASRAAMDKLKFKFPYDIRDVEPAINAELLEYFKGLLCPRIILNDYI